jgi:hypothetical protein
MLERGQRIGIFYVTVSARNVADMKGRFRVRALRGVAIQKSPGAAKSLRHFPYSRHNVLQAFKNAQNLIMV